jgi:hypothetical protein
MEAGLDPGLATHLLVANLGTRRVVTAPAVIANRPEFRFGMNSGAAPGGGGAARRRLPIASLMPASKRPALSLS